VQTTFFGPTGNFSCLSYTLVNIVTLSCQLSLNASGYYNFTIDAEGMNVWLENALIVKLPPSMPYQANYSAFMLQGIVPTQLVLDTLTNDTLSYRTDDDIIQNLFIRYIIVAIPKNGVVTVQTSSGFFQATVGSSFRGSYSGPNQFSLTLFYLPNLYYYGLDNFTFTVVSSDSPNFSVTSNVSINITHVQQNPIFQGLTEFRTLMSANLSIPLVVTDPNQDTDIFNYTIYQVSGLGALWNGTTKIFDSNDGTNLIPFEFDMVANVSLTYWSNYNFGDGLFSLSWSALSSNNESCQSDTVTMTIDVGVSNQV
jgi:hypothetical protein